MKPVVLAACLVLFSLPAHGANYYISPSGSNSNSGTSQAAPWLTFAHAIHSLRASCGDTLFLLDGTYGDGTSTGKIAVANVLCTLGDELTIAAINQRKAKIVDNGSGHAVIISDSSYIVIDGLYARSTDNASSGAGSPIYTLRNTNLIIRNTVTRNPNHNANRHAISVQNSTKVLLEDNEAYSFHRHCIEAWQSNEVVVRRQYCNPREGRIPGGLNGTSPLGAGDALISMYPCRDCVLENAIADGTTAPLYLAEMNATFGSSVLMSGSKILGSICYKCNYGNGIYPNPRTVADLNHTPQNILIKDVAIVDATPANGIRCSDCVNVTIENVTVLGAGDFGVRPSSLNGGNGIGASDTAVGATPAQSSVFIRDSVVTGMTNNNSAFAVLGASTWSGDRLVSFGNVLHFSPPPPANWTNISTANPNLGSCKVWVPDGSPLKGAGTGGGDIGASILYRYVNGVKTSIPLWNTTTGEFPHGAADLDGINRVAGQSLFDFHTRVNVNINGCPFPSSYVGGGSGGSGNVVSSTDLSGPHVHQVTDGPDRSLTVGVMVRHDGLATDSPLTVTSSCGGEVIPPLGPAWITAAGDRSIRTLGKINPTSGSCTLTPTFTGGNVSGWIMLSREDGNSGSYGPLAADASVSATPSVTVQTSPGERVVDFLATSNVPSLVVGASQTLAANTSHATKVLRGASSEQSGSSGGSMTYALSGSYGWVMQGVSIIPPSGGSSSGTVTQTQHQVFRGYGPEPTVESIGQKNGPAVQVGVDALVRIRYELEGSGSPTTAFVVRPYCQRNGGAYFQVQDLFGSNAVRFFGEGLEIEHPKVPSSLSALTQKLSAGNFRTSAFLRGSNSVFTIPSLQVGQRVEIEVALNLNASVGDVIACRLQKSNGDLLTYGPSGVATLSIRHGLGAID